MPIHKATPGPRGLSCLTCRQRRKKCDRVRPVCERCTKGNFECLGYDNDELESEPISDVAGRSTESSGCWESQCFQNFDSTKPINTREAKPIAVSANATPSESSIATPEPEASFSMNPLDPLGLCEVSGPSILAVGILDQIALSQRPGCMSEFDGRSTLHSSGQEYDNVWSQNQSSSLARSSMIPEADASRRRAMPPEVLRAVHDIGNAMGLLQRSIPPSVNAGPQMKECYLKFTLKEYETARMCHYFKRPPKDLIENLAVRMTRSGTILSFMYLGARIFRVLTDKTQNTNIQSCIRWVNRVDDEFTQNPLSNPPVAAIEDRLSGLLELAFLKFVVINTVAGYLLLQRSLPIFLQIVSNDPTLWSEHRGVLRISLPRALDTPRYEVRRFVFYDTMCAFVLGVPPLGEYDSSDFPVVPEDPPQLEWVHGVPVELTINIAQVHAWRSSHPGLANEEDWAVLELRTAAWKPGMEQLADGDSVKMVERAAIQETWRHATLIYIYMGMCRVNSHDPRVRSSVQQIVRLMSLVTETPVNIHFSVPCLIAGIAARSERQRAFLRNKLASFQNIRIWILRGAEFCAVLDHLWHGVAANGNAATWDDYVNSRCVMLPIQ